MSVLDPGCSAQLACRNEQRDRGGQNEIYIYIWIVLLHRCKLCHATLISAEEVGLLLIWLLLHLRPSRALQVQTKRC